MNQKRSDFDRERGSAQILGALLVEGGTLTPSELESVLDLQRESGERLGRIVVREGLAGEASVAKALAYQLGLAFDAGPLSPEPAAARLVSGAFARRKEVVPLRLEGKSLRVAMADPLDLASVDDLQFQSGRRVKVVVATPQTIARAIQETYEEEVSALARELPSDGASSEGSRRSEAPRGTPLVRLVDLLLHRAAEHGASDLHVEQTPHDVRVRERVDGVLRRVTEIPPGSRAQLVSRIKVLAGMDISIKRRPQDGGFTFVHADRSLNVRVSTLPVERGEKAVLRILDPGAAPGGLEELGFSTRDLRRVRRLVHGGQGVILAAGPTGSGKSSTLFGALGELDRTGRNVVTLEDPIEYRMEGVNQVQVDPRAGLTFPAALRSLLRQDPDVIMVGEIRDRETAEIAMAAAITGHLVLSTIHTMDAPSGVTRLLQMGVPGHLVTGGLIGIVAQRLVRRRCPECGGRPSGCSYCHDGYRGRTGVFQVLQMTEALRGVVSQGGEASELRRRAEEAGMETMAADARRKVSEGVTTPHEVARVLREAPGDAQPCSHCGEGVPPEGLGCPHCGWCRVRSCVCGRVLQHAWRFCPDCLRQAPAHPIPPRSPDVKPSETGA